MNNMPNYNDFDLDIRRVNDASGDGVSPAMFSDNPMDCASILKSIVEYTLQYCPTANDCPVTKTNCTAESCSDCHSYCGAACRR